MVYVLRLFGVGQIGNEAPEVLAPHRVKEQETVMGMARISFEGEGFQESTRRNERVSFPMRLIRGEPNLMKWVCEDLATLL